MNRRISVLFLTNIPSPYMVGYLNELGKYCDLSVVFEKEYDATRPESWRNLLNNVSFKYSLLKGKGVSQIIYGDMMDSAPDDKALSFSVIKHINSSFDFVIVANPCTPTGIVEIAYMKMKKIPYSIQSEGGYPGTGKGIKERLKYWLIHNAEFYFSTCEMDDNYFIKYGALKDRIKRYPFASISKNKLLNQVIEDDQKRDKKTELGISYKKMILCVGRSVYVKGFDVLLKSLKDMPNDTCTFFVGGECTEDYQRIIEENDLSNIFFVNNVDQDTLIKYYMAADIFVLPTRSDTWGLVINEAMAYGLPVITTNMCVAGNALIENGVNGYIVNSGDFMALRRCINMLLDNPTLARQFGKISFNKVNSWTFENMGKIMYKHIESIKKDN